MNENEKLQNEELSLLGLLKILLSKIKILILVLLCGGLLGGAIGFATSYNVYYWGTNMEFYVNPVRPEKDDDANLTSGSTYGVYGAYGKHVMDNIIRLLNSESFGELLILNGEVLPETGKWVDPLNEKEVALGLDDKIIEADAVYKVALEKQNDYLALNTEKTDAYNIYNAAMKKLNPIWLKHFNNDEVANSSFNEDEYLRLKNVLNDDYLNEAYNEMKVAENIYNDKKEAAAGAKEIYLAAAKISEAKIKDALTAWRKTKSYQEQLSFILDSVEFSYVQDKKDLENAVDLARSFIYVELSVLGEDSQAFAEDLLTCVQAELPKYVCEKMIIPDGYASTSCTQITTVSDISLMNEGYILKQSIKFALLLAAIAVVVACVVVIFLDRLDKRVRDYDAVARQLNIPLLGVIPSIDDDRMVSWKDAKNQKKEA